MNKEKLFQLRRTINELFFKKRFQKDKSAKKNIYPGNLLVIGLNHLIRILPKI